MVMGSGKTLVALACHEMCFQRTFILTNKNVVPHIKRDIMSFVPCHRDSICVYSHDDTESYLNQDTDFLVIDEVHTITKHMVSSINTIHRKFTLLMSGTPGSQKDQSRYIDDLKCTKNGETFLLSSCELLVRPIMCLQYMDMTESQTCIYTTNLSYMDGRMKPLIRFRKMNLLREMISGWKIQEISTILKRSINFKIAIFSEFNKPLTLLSKLIHEVAISTIDRTPTDRDMLLNMFRSDMSKTVILLKVQHFANGVDLGFCDGLIFMEPIWKDVARKQAISRLMRIGQKPSQKIIQFVYKNTLETKLINEDDFDVVL